MYFKTSRVRECFTSSKTYSEKDDKSKEKVVEERAGEILPGGDGRECKVWTRIGCKIGTTGKGDY